LRLGGADQAGGQYRGKHEVFEAFHDLILRRVVALLRLTSRKSLSLWLDAD